MNSPSDLDRVCTLETSGRCELEANLEILRTIPVFSGIPLPRLKLYAYLSRRMCFRAGDFIFRQGETGHLGYILVSGKAQVIREFADHSVLLNELKEGEFFGGLALFSEIKRLFSIRCTEVVECLVLDREAFRKLLLQFPEVALRVLDLMISRLTAMEEKLLQAKSHECLFKGKP